jgi:hypothetical protein
MNATVRNGSRAGLSDLCLESGAGDVSPANEPLRRGVNPLLQIVLLREGEDGQDNPVLVHVREHLSAAENIILTREGLRGDERR